MTSSTTGGWHRNLMMAFLLMVVLAIHGESTAQEEHPPQEKLRRSEFVILFSSDAFAGLMPCDCPVYPYGGLARRMEYQARVQRAVGKDRVLLLDAGGAVAGNMEDDRSRGDERDLLRTRFYFEALKESGCVATCVGADDLRFGSEFLRTLPIPVISCNLFREGERVETVFPTHVIWKSGDTTVWVIGVSPRIFDRTSSMVAAREGLEARDPVIELTRTLSAIQAMPEWSAAGRDNVVVVLSQLGKEKTVALANRSGRRHGDGGVDLFLYGNRTGTRPDFVVDGMAPVLGGARQGRYMGRVDIGGSGGDRILVPSPVAMEPGIGRSVYWSNAVKKFLNTMGKAGSRELVLVDFYLDPTDRRQLQAMLTLERVLAELTHKGDGDGAWPEIQLTCRVVPGLDGTGNLVLREDRTGRSPDPQLVAALLFDYYPDRVFDLARSVLKAVPGQTVLELATGMEGINPIWLRNGLKAGEATSLLMQWHDRAERIGVGSLPVLGINRKYYTGYGEVDAILSSFCRALIHWKECPACARFGDCLSETDCDAGGEAFSVCERLEEGVRSECKELPKLKGINVVYLYDRRASFIDDPTRVVDSLSAYTKGKVNITRIEGTSDEGSNLLALTGARRLPLYVVDVDARTLARYPGAKKRVGMMGGRTIWLDERMPANIRVDREWSDRQRIDLFVNFRELKVLKSVKAMFDMLSDAGIPLTGGVDSKGQPFWTVGSYIMHIHPIVWMGSSRLKQDRGPQEKRFEPTLTAWYGTSEVQASARHEAMQVLSAGTYAAYIQALIDGNGSTWWEDAVRAAGVDPIDCRHLADTYVTTEHFRDTADLVDELELRDSVLHVLLNNREDLPLQKLTDLGKRVLRVCNRK